MSETGLFRVLDADDQRLLFVPAGSASDAGDATDGPGLVDETMSGPGVPSVDGPTGGTGTPAPDRSYDPVVVPATGHGDADATLAALLPGYLVRATLSWTDLDPRVESVTVRKRTLFTVADDVVNLFEAARTTWRTATARGEAMGSRVLRGTDGEPNGVVYVFADPDGVDRLAEFRTGERPIEPLLARVNAAADDAGHEDPTVSVGPSGIHVTGERSGTPDHDLGPDREVFLLRPADGQFVVVLIALRKGGTLANTVRDTYHRPRPDEG